MKLAKLVPILSGLFVSAISSLVLADVDIPMPHCSTALTPARLTVSGVMFIVGAAALFVSRRHRKG